MRLMPANFFDELFWLTPVIAALSSLLTFLQLFLVEDVSLTLFDAYDLLSDISWALSCLCY